MREPTILGHLAQFASFHKQGELLCTQGLAYLLETHEDARSSFTAEVKARLGIDLGGPLTWHAEPQQDDRGRPDLEARAADGLPVVKVEGKLGAELGAAQLQSYAVDLRRGKTPGVLMVLVPASRVDEAAEVAAGAFDLPRGGASWPSGDGEFPGVSVISWDALFKVLGRGGSSRLQAELEQLEAMYHVLNGDYIAPLADVEELRDWRERETDFVNLVDKVTRRLTTHHKTYPMGFEPLEQITEGLEPEGYRRRYVCLPLRGDMPCFSIGVRDSFSEWVTPIWLRFHSDTKHLSLIRHRIAASRLRWLESVGHIWIPLDVPLGIRGERMVDALVEQAGEVVRVVFDEEG